MEVRIFRIFLVPALVLGAFAAAAVAADKVNIGDFSAGSLTHWKTQSFAGDTEYNIEQRDGKSVLVANSSGTASALGRKIKVDLTKTPYVNWSWKVDSAMSNLDERSKQGDDYAARLYVVKSSGALFWKTKAVNYVWSGNEPKDTSWKSAWKPKNDVMVAVRGPDDSLGEWKTEKRNVREDFKKIYGIDIKRIEGVAIMTDTDNSGLSATAEYGDIYFSAE
ncbi:DUF3047 domain-containing protein [Granulosicoccus sp.]|nr:DUF3047 domain-containing protein [Granulosicoccus sp.]